MKPKQKKPFSKGKVFIRWADWDPSYEGNVRLQIYDSKKDQNGSSPNRLYPFKVRIAAALGIHPNGGRYGSNLARLRTMGLIPDRGDIYLTDGARA